MDTQQVGRNMMLLRLEKGLSQQGLAELCNVTHQAVSKWENGAALPDMQTMLFLSKFYGVPMEDILSGVLSMDSLEQDETGEAAFAENAGEPDQMAAQSLPAAQGDAAPAMDWERIVELAPFASQKTLETLAERCAEADEKQLCSLAPFLSAAYLDKLARRLNHARADLVVGLAPFLPRETVDWLILNRMDGANQAETE